MNDKIQYIMDLLEGREKTFKDACIFTLEDTNGNEMDADYQRYSAKLEEIMWIKNYIKHQIL